MRRLGPLACFLVVVSAILFAQTSEHQRTAVTGKNDLRCTISCSSLLYTITTDAGPSLETESGLGIDLIIEEKFGVSASMPFIVITRLKKDEINKFLFALGDPAVSINATGRIGDWQVSVKFAYTYPFGIWNSYQAKEYMIMSGSGYHRIEGIVSALRYMDPLAAGFSLSLEHCFGKPYRLGVGTIPFSVGLGVFATEALNSVAALSGSLHQHYSSAPQINGIPEQSSGAYSLSVSASLLINRNQRSISIGLSKSLSDLSSPAAFTIEAALTFKRGD